MFWFNKPGANTKTVMFKVKFCMKSIRQRPHELKAKSSIDRRIEILGKTDAIVSHFHHERAIISRLAVDMDLHR